MNPNDFLFYYFILIIIVILIVGIFYLINKQNIKKVLENSENIKLLFKVNQFHEFHKFYDKDRYIHYSLDSKRNFDRMDFETVIYEYFQKNNNNILSDMNAIYYNYKKYPYYLSDFFQISKETPEEIIRNLKISKTKFYKIEKRLMEEYKLKDVYEYNVKIVIDYLSPRGRNYYKKDINLNYINMMHFYKEYCKKLEEGKNYEIRVKIERAKMSDSLRYNILKRDMFKCCICGASAKEGAKLHVDHIIPVSKNGKTTPSNLQTLCDRCNLGKSNKM